MDRFDFILTEADPCAEIMDKAETYFKKPLEKLEYKDLPVNMCANRDEDQTLGDCVYNIPRPGDVAGCLKKGKLWKRSF